MDYDRLRELQAKFEENPRRYFAPLANEYRKGGQPKRAIEICRAHLAQMPGHMSGQVVYGQSLFEGGEFDEARKVFEGALVLDPENLIALRSLGDLSLQAGDTQQARSWYSRLLDADPKDQAVITLLEEIDASSDAAPPTAAAEIPGVDIDAGDQPAPVVETFSIPGSESTFTVDFSFMNPPQEQAAATETVEEKPSEPEQAVPTAAEPPDGFTPTSEPPPAAAGASGTSSFVGSTPEPFVNETMAQLYLQQGYKQLALRVYRQLAEMRPNEQALKDRIAEIEASQSEEAEAAPQARRDDAPSIEAPTPEPAAPRAPSIESPVPHGPGGTPSSVESPGFDGSTIDSVPASTPNPEPDSMESPVREEPRAEPEGIAARQQAEPSIQAQPSIGEFFATLGRRRPARPSSARGGQSGEPYGGGMAAVANSGSGASPASLDAVFAGTTVNAKDARAASTLAGAFSATSRGTTPPPPPATPTPRSTPRMQTQESEEDVAKFRAWLDGLTGE